MAVDPKSDKSTSQGKGAQAPLRTSISGKAIKVLVVEDEEPIRTGLCDVLKFQGFDPEPVERGDDGLERARSGEHEFVLLDVMLPGLSGFEVCEKLRESDPDIPVLILTARGSEEDVLRGFQCGADDYVVKPFSIRELTARIDALLRRRGKLAAPPPASNEPFDFGGYRVDPEELLARNAERKIDLTRRDVEILRLFARERGRIVSRRVLLSEVWGFPDPESVETRSVDMHIAKLRKKFTSSDTPLIETVRGEGYRHPN